jgi:hypothetical protein
MTKFSPPRAARDWYLGLLCVLVTVMATLHVSPFNAQRQGSEDDVDWRYYGNDPANTRFQNIDQITPANAPQIKVAWVFHTGVVDSTTAFEGTPIVVDGRMYVSTGHNDVFALNAATGKQIWAYHPTDMLRWHRFRCAAITTIGAWRLGKGLYLKRGSTPHWSLSMSRMANRYGKLRWMTGTTATR